MWINVFSFGPVLQKYFQGKDEKKLDYLKNSIIRITRIN